MPGVRRRITPPLTRSLSVRLLVLTIFFVMLAEVLIYAPSLSNFRINWLEEKVRTAHLAILALQSTPERLVSEELKNDLLQAAQAYAVVLRTPDRRLLLYTTQPPQVDTTINAPELSTLNGVGDAFATLLRPANNVVHLLGPSPRDPRLTIEVVFDEVTLRDDMRAFSRNILFLSLIISLITGGLLYFTLLCFVVRPMRRITRGITEFANNPEDATAGLKPTRRRDEIGLAQSVLVEMQEDVRASLHQKEHLAALGSAVSKISHDLRGILSTALLVSDRLSQLDNPDVKRMVPPLVQAIDRAINLCTQTLSFARDEGPRLTGTRFRLRGLVEDVCADIAAVGTDGVHVENKVGDELVLEADRDQLYRVFANLARNAIEAGAHEVRVSAQNGPGEIRIDVEDDGPGLPAAARDRLFKPFAGSAKRGGTGLGLAIARDVMRAHGGDIEMVRSGDTGTSFRLHLPKGDRA